MHCKPLFCITFQEAMLICTPRGNTGPLMKRSEKPKCRPGLDLEPVTLVRGSEHHLLTLRIIIVILFFSIVIIFTLQHHKHHDHTNLRAAGESEFMTRKKIDWNFTCDFILHTQCDCQQYTFLHAFANSEATLHGGRQRRCKKCRLSNPELSREQHMMISICFKI